MVSYGVWVLVAYINPKVKKKKSELF